jgi:Esterase PHB depolymerase
MGLKISSLVEVTRLTDAGRLSAALALLQRPPQKPRSPEAPREHDRKQVRTALSGGQDIDMAPQGSDSGSWTAPRFDARHGIDTALNESLTQPHAPKIMRGFLDHLGRLGGDSSLRGMPAHRAEDVRAALPAGARFEECSYANEAGSRTYKLYIPGHYCGEPLPLIVMLHGCKQSPDDFARGTQMNELAQEQGFVVAHPGQPSSANSSKCWNWFDDNDDQGRA